jgi:seryl-tRNA(Sec) selenium transferase
MRPLGQQTQITRRRMLQASGALSAFGLAATAIPATAALPHYSSDAEGFQAPAGFPQLNGHEKENLFTQIGVRPILNARGTYTIITGSCSLPEVKRAMYEASFYFVQLDELMAAVGKEIASLMGAPSAIVTTGCEAAIALATLACTAGADIEKCQALPYVREKTKVIIPKHSRNPYDFGVRTTGAEIVEVETAEQLEDSLTAQVAMIYVMSSPEAAKGPLSIANICRIAEAKGTPVFVDAAAEEPLSPNIHIQAGASLVGYSGGKCIRGPQAAGVLLGNADLIQAAWFQAAPHHNYGRGYKVGKEEIMGMLAAVRQWYKRDHAAEWKQWQSWLDIIGNRVKSLPSVTTEILQPEDLSNHSPQLRVHWDTNVLKITGRELEAKLDAGTPRILIGQATGTRPDHMASAITIMPYMMAPGEAEIVADAVYEGLSRPGSYQNPAVPTGETAQLGGTWVVLVDYLCGTGMQRFELKQNNEEISGMLYGEIYRAALSGVVQANQVKLKGTMQTNGYEVHWTFQGTTTNGHLSGMADMGEYGSVPWQAFRVPKQ